jgi:hypothetical protein
MSIENTLERIALALEAIANSKGSTFKQFAEPAVVPTQAAPVAAPVPTLAAMQSTLPAAVAAPVTPPVTFTIEAAPVAVVAASTAPFSDKAGLTAYTMSVYKELGAVKGAAIQNVLVSLGVSNINEVTPTMYSQYHAALESLKVS